MILSFSDTLAVSRARQTAYHPLIACGELFFGRGQLCLVGLFVRLVRPDDLVGLVRLVAIGLDAIGLVTVRLDIGGRHRGRRGSRHVCHLNGRGDDNFCGSRTRVLKMYIYLAACGAHAFAADRRLGVVETHLAGTARSASSF